MTVVTNLRIWRHQTFIFSYVVLMTAFMLGHIGYASAADVTGTWTGTITQPRGPVVPIFDVEFTFTQAGDGTISGTRTIRVPEQPQYYGILSLKGKMIDQTMTFSEISVIEQNLPPSASRWCLITATLTYTSPGPTLTGPWQAPGCSPGDIKITKSKTDKPQELEVAFSLFIPANYVYGGPTETCFKKDGLKPYAIYYKGDDRSFAKNGSSSRGRHSFSVTSDVASDADGLKDGSLKTIVGETRSYASDALARVYGQSWMLIRAKARLTKAA